MTEDADHCPDHTIYCSLCVPGTSSHKIGRCLRSAHEWKDVDDRHHRQVCPDCGAKHVIISKTICLDPACRVCQNLYSYTGRFGQARGV